MGSGSRDRLLARLEEAVAAPDANGHLRIEWTRVLVELCTGLRRWDPGPPANTSPDDVARTARCLLGLARDRSIDGGNWRLAAEDLLKLGQAFHADALAALRDLAEDPYTSPMLRRLTAEALARTSPDDLPVAAAALEVLAGDYRVERRERAAAALSLGELGPKFRDRAIVAAEHRGLGTDGDPPNPGRSW
jgi:hypothetical protein